jgi:predicted transposase YdaD
MTPKTTQKVSRGTDDPFYQLMQVSGSSVLKLFGLSQEEADQYQFKAVVLKDKSLKPDVEGRPYLENAQGRVFLESQGYLDKFIRHRLLAEVFWSCRQEGYTGPVWACILYTQKEYQQKAESLTQFRGAKNCQLADCIHEIVLTDYTEAELLRIDPHLVILVPLTITDPTQVKLWEKAAEWKATIKQVFPEERQADALNVLGLFVLHQFRHITVEEVLAMLNFDWMETRAGQQTFEKGRQTGLLDGMQQGTQEMLLEALGERFSNLTNQLVQQIQAIDQPAILKQLLKPALRCQTVEEFQELLAKTT